MTQAPVRARTTTSTPGGAARGTTRGPAPRTRRSDPRPAARPLSPWPVRVLAAVMLLASLLAIDEVLVGSDWVLWPTLATAWVVGLGLALRPTRLPALGVTLVQLVALAGLLALVFGVRSPADVGEVARIALAHIEVSGAPAGVVPAVEVVLTGVVGLTAVVVDALAARVPALVALPAAAVVATGATFDPTALPWFALVAPGAAYVAVLAAAGPARSSRVASGRAGGRGGRAGHTASHPASPAARAGAAGLGVLALVAALAATNASGVRADGRLERTTSAGIGTASPFTGLVGDLLRGDDRPLLRFTSPAGPRYLRTAALTEWTNDSGWAITEDLERDRPPQGAGGTEVDIETLDLTSRFLPVLEGTTGVTADGGLRHDPGLDTYYDDEPTEIDDYSLRLDPALPSVEELRADTVSPRRDEIEVGDLDPRVRRLAQEATQGASTSFDQALALQRWFTTASNGFVYSLRVPEGTSGDALVDFLELRRGYCEQYASAMGVMLRSLDIPARVVVGFGSGTTDAAGVTTVTSHNAHAWVEVRFDGAGWVRFDPTPGGGGQGGQAAPAVAGLDPADAGGGAQPEAPDPGTQDPTPGDPNSSAAPEQPEETGADPTAGATTPGDGATPSPTDPSDGATAGGAGSAGSGDGADAGPWTHVGRGEIALLVALALLTGPQAWRWRRGRRRLAVAARGGGAGAAAAWEEVEDLALDHAVVVPRSASLRAAAAVIADEARLPAPARERLDVLVRACEQRWFAGGRDGSAPPNGGSAGRGGSGGSGRSGGADRVDADGEVWVKAVGDVAIGLEHHRPPSAWRWWWPPSLRATARRSAPAAPTPVREQGSRAGAGV
ncbi:transglutaminase-like domain-containing protein [Litorihabitans aurantiacus]|uniref:Transglutaminase-like domain-containing protein n=1 Tax=Litorihabitans aurantiacus TaxID=1930061 RepID=A0AA37XGI9_9MICO|nr:transglutaminase-like domain-containing protein [Litorihabitans aurantiacus]GMA32911.1 hypothetical protein GCM10025875_29030 [Litorihabitans aurantiacus]